MDLPDPIARYFAADADLAGAAPAEAFAPDATVLDEGETHRAARRSPPGGAPPSRNTAIERSLSS